MDDLIVIIGLIVNNKMGIFMKYLKWFNNTFSFLNISGAV